MLIFQEVLNKVSFEEVWSKMLEYYPDLGQTNEKYSTVYESLLSKNLTTNLENMIIHIDAVDSDDSPNRDYIEYRVHGKNNSPEWNGYWDISANNWDEWLGFYVDHKAIDNFSSEQIVALCLYEMTWFGFTEEQIKSKTDNLENDKSSQ